jgi:uncharacterized protein (TIGR00251 family)
MNINLKIFPNSGKQEIVEIGEKEFEVYLKSSPENNKANVELIKILKKYFGREVKIKMGKTSRRKIVEVIDGN